MTFTIRPGRQSDRRAILGMLYEFLDYFAGIDAEESGSFSDQALARTAGLAFGRNPAYSVLVAESKGKPVAFLAYHFGVWEIYSALYVAGLVVKSPKNDDPAIIEPISGNSDLLERR